jgi:3-oxoacyl-[acyl-carrier protein] reductase
MQMQTLQDKVVLITGGAQGIGSAIATLFAQEGATVIIGDMNAEIGRETQDRINRSIPQELKGSAIFKVLNVTDDRSIECVVSTVIDTLGRIDILINNAGITRDSSFAKMSDENFRAVFEVNVFGLQRMTKAVLPHMLNQKSGVILNASSVVAANGNFGQANYAASKAAVEIFTKTLAKEYARKGIRANALAPGFTKTAMTSAIPDDIQKVVEGKIPLGRFATPEEIAHGYLFLATATYVTGAILPVDGGLVVG